jgi:hypothetical protein
MGPRGLHVKPLLDAQTLLLVAGSLLPVKRNDGIKGTSNQQLGTRNEQQILAFFDKPELKMVRRREERRER